MLDYSATCSEYEPNSESEVNSEANDPTLIISSKKINKTLKRGKLGVFVPWFTKCR